MNTQNYSKEQLEKLTEATTKQTEDMMNFGKNGFDAWMKSTNIFMDGAQDMFKSLTEMTNSARETQATAAKQMMSCKNLNDMTEISTKITQDTMEQAMSNATTLSEKTIKLCMESSEPLNDQMTKTAQETMKKAKKAA